MPQFKQNHLLCMHNKDKYCPTVPVCGGMGHVGQSGTALYRSHS